jgi:hypothetical protein
MNLHPVKGVGAVMQQRSYSPLAIILCLDANILNAGSSVIFDDALDASMRFFSLWDLHKLANDWMAKAANRIVSFCCSSCQLMSDRRHLSS